VSALASMTGFGRAEGAASGLSWVWELRSVNGRGLDLRLRLPIGFDALESELRQEAARQLKRGNVNAALTVDRQDRARIAIDRELLEELQRLVRELAPGAAPARPEALLALPGVLKSANADTSIDPAQAAAVRAGFAAALAELLVSRRTEGARLQTLLVTQLDEIAALRDLATEQARSQPELQRARMLDSLQALLRDQPGLPQERIAQEVALLATRSDVREELDRLGAHIDAARALLEEAVGVGRKFDFLVQEFVRETNTLCSKSASVPLTATGLRLKAVIEQLREQVQNVE
jgi:uncharacterized protein (TIGR00255 family)